MSRALSGSFAAALAALAASACTPKLECESLSECAQGQICSRDNRCVPAPDAGPPAPISDAGPIDPFDAGPRGDGGTGPRETIVALQSDPTSLQQDPRPGHEGELLVTLYAPGGFDRAVSHSVEDGDEIGVAFDFQNAGEPCNLDVLRYEDEPNLTNASVDELWMACGVEPRFRIEYTGRPLDAPHVSMTTGSAQVLARFPPEQGGDAYRLVAARGGDALYSILLDDVDLALEQPRAPEVVAAGAPYSNIVQIFSLPPGNDNTAEDFAVVFDRGAPDELIGPRLVFLKRQANSSAWALNTNLGVDGDGVIDVDDGLPAGTHAIRVVGPVSTLGAAGNADNLVAFAPEAGTAYFFRLEDMNAVGDPTLLYEPNGGRTGTLPPPDDEILLEHVPGTGFYYATTTSSRVWLIPEDPGGEGLVRRADLDVSTDRPNGMVPADATSVWITVPNRRELHRYPLIR